VCKEKNNKAICGPPEDPEDVEDDNEIVEDADDKDGDDKDGDDKDDDE
jgi:hypothetical protein